MTGPWLGIAATDGLVSLRFGGFYRIEADGIAEVYAFHDLIDLMRQAGINPLPAPPARRPGSWTRWRFLGETIARAANQGPNERRLWQDPRPGPARKRDRSARDGTVPSVRPSGRGQAAASQNRTWVSAVASQPSSR
jgi:hypothetical protein